MKSFLVLVSPPLVLTLLLLACGSVPSPGGLEKHQRGAGVVDLIIEQIIEGEVLGQKLLRPIGVAIDKLGRIYVVDAGNNRLLQFSSERKAVREVGGFGTGSNLLNDPSYVTVDNDLNLVVSDEGNRRMVRFDQTLNFVEEIRFEDPDNPLDLGRPSGLALTSYGEMWVSDEERNRIAVFDNTGNFDRFVGDFGDASGQLSSPGKIIRYPEHGFMVADAGNGRLVVYDEFGTFDFKISNEYFDYPIAAAPYGQQTWVLDQRSGLISLVSNSGSILFSVGPQLIGSFKPLRQPSDLAVMADGRLFISDTGNNRLLICRPISADHR